MKVKENIETKISGHSALLFIEEKQQYITLVHGEFLGEKD
jgi:hypothetical protein